MPEDLVQCYPQPGAAVSLRTTEDRSSTRLLLRARTADWRGVQLELSAGDVQRLAGAMLDWLVANGHPIPEVQWPDDLIPWEEDQDDDGDAGQPATVVVPEHTR